MRRHSKHSPFALIVAATLALAVGGFITPASAQAVTSSAAWLSGATVVVSAGTPGKSPEIHNAQWVALKLAHRLSAPGVVLPAGATPQCVTPCDIYKILNGSVTGTTIEAPGYGTDDHGDNYVDKYLWSFCAAGAVDNALYYWNGKTNTYPAGWYTEPSYANYHTKLYWTSSDHNRSYEMYLADQVWVPGWGTPGLVTFYNYPYAGAGLGDVTNTLNWEASGHSSNWQNYFYVTVSSSGLSAATLQSDIVSDINGGHAVVAEVDTGYLPNWRTALYHFITIIGYDTTAGVYYYTDTCGTACGSTTNGGINMINQSKPDKNGKDLYSAILYGGGFSW